MEIQAWNKFYGNNQRISFKAWNKFYGFSFSDVRTTCEKRKHAEGWLQKHMQKVHNYRVCLYEVRELVSKSAASAASPDYVKLQAVIKSAASAASPQGGRASGRLDHGLLFAMFGNASGQN